MANWGPSRGLTGYPPIGVRGRDGKILGRLGLKGNGLGGSAPGFLGSGKLKPNRDASRRMWRS